MFVRVFTLRFSDATDGFDNQPVETFLADKDVLSIHDHYFEKDGIPYIALVVCFRTKAVDPVVEGLADKKSKRDESWREFLPEADWPLFNTLRNWRNERSKQEGIPPYVICNNRQLAEIIKSRCNSLEALRQIEGLGDAKLTKYGQQLLALLAKFAEVPANSEGRNAKT